MVAWGVGNSSIFFSGCLQFVFLNQSNYTHQGYLPFFRIVSSSWSGRNPFQWKILRCFVACQEDLSIPWFTKSIPSWTCPLLWSLRKLASQWHQLQSWRSTPLYILLGLIERGAYKLPAAKHSRYRLSLRAWSCVSLVYVYCIFSLQSLQ